MVEPLKAELRHFVRVARGEETARADAESGVMVVRILEAASRSLDKGGALVDLS
jgi:predicted dehydrogenase